MVKVHVYWQGIDVQQEHGEKFSLLYFIIINVHHKVVVVNVLSVFCKQYDLFICTILTASTDSGDIKMKPLLNHAARLLIKHSALLRWLRIPPSLKMVVLCQPFMARLHSLAELWFWHSSGSCVCRACDRIGISSSLNRMWQTKMESRLECHNEK